MKQRKTCSGVKFNPAWTAETAIPTMAWWKKYVEAGPGNKKELENLWGMTQKEREWREQELGKMDRS